MSLLLNCILIFFTRIVDVSLGTVRTVILVRGKRVLGSVIGFFEVAVWFLIVSQALEEASSNLWIVIAYSAGFAAGTYIGSWIEEKLAIGTSSMQVITKGERYDLVDALRESNFAVSTITSEGRTGKNLLLLIEINRREINKVRRIINRIDPGAFITILDVNTIVNGYI